MFHIVEILPGTRESSAPMCMSDGKPFVYVDGADAAEHARLWSSCNAPRKAQPRRIAAAESNSWIARESERCMDGTYTLCPQWFIDALPAASAALNHFPHVSQEDASQLAYTPSADKGIADRQSRLKPGRYLSQHFSDSLTSDQIRDLATRWNAELCPQSDALKFAHTADEIEHVYTYGPSSCMAHAASSFDSPFHPVRVYAAGDLAVAYYQEGDSSRITARALCWPERKLHGRIFGDETRLGDLLAEAGYSEGTLIGARMRRVEHGNGFVVPYVDAYPYQSGSGAFNADDNGEFLIIAKRGDVSCGSTTGVSECKTWSCDACGESYESEDDISYVECLDRYVCADCRDNSTFVCEATGDRYRNDDAVTLHDGTTWCDSYAADHAAECDATHEMYPVDELVPMSGSEADNLWNQRYFRRNGFVCDVTGENYSKDDLVTLPDGRTVCTDAADAITAETEDGQSSPPGTRARPKLRPLSHSDRVRLTHDGQMTFRAWLNLLWYRMPNYDPASEPLRIARHGFPEYFD